MRGRAATLLLPLTVEHYIDDCARRGTPPRVKELATILGMSRWSLCRAWSRHSGHALSDHLRSRQIAIAKKLLRETDSPITAVASLSGFTSARQLHRIFRRVLARTPDECRRD